MWMFIIQSHPYAHFKRIVSHSYCCFVDFVITLNVHILQFQFTVITEIGKGFIQNIS